ncbi:MAG: septum formation initiator family protein [Firmicutes bacterium]|nr:septum formation initiator family protein [Bacillota bacterium]
MEAAGKVRESAFPPPEPKRSYPRRKSFNLSRSKLPTIVMLILLGYLAITFGSQLTRLSSMNRDVQNIKQQVQELQQKNAALREELRLVQSDAYVEKTAREKLGLVKQGETRVVAVPQGTQLKKIQPPEKDNVVAD